MRSSTLTKAVAIAVSLTAGTAFADMTFKTDQGHTEVFFSWSHAGVSIQTGEFEKAEGTVTLADKMEDSTVEVVIDASSVSSGVSALDDHLKSPDFLEVEKYPNMTFKSTSIKMTGDTTMDVTGDLTIHGVTKEVTLTTEMTHKGPHPLGKSIDYYKGEWVAFQATTEIDHQAFGVGGFSTGPITININTELKAAE